MRRMKLWVRRSITGQFFQLAVHPDLPIVESSISGQMTADGLIKLMPGMMETTHEDGWIEIDLPFHELGVN